MATNQRIQPINKNILPGVIRESATDSHHSAGKKAARKRLLRRKGLLPVKSSPTVKERLLAAEGGYYLSGEAAKLLGITEPQLEQLCQTDKIIGLPVKDGRHVYPKWQLTKHWFWGYRVLPGLAEVLAAFPDDSPWMRAAFMLNDSDCVEFPTPLAGLKAGKLDRVIALSQRFGEHGAA
jgi:ribosomal protein L35